MRAVLGATVVLTAVLSPFADRPTGAAADGAGPGAADSAAAPARARRDPSGWYPPADPESASVRLGRRDAPAVTLPLSGGRQSLEALGRAVLAAVSAGEPVAMHALCVNKREFEVVLWPEFPESRPATGLVAMDGWRALSNRLVSGCHGAVSDHGGRAWTLVSIEATAGVRPYRNFRLHRGLVLVARGPGGEERRFDFLRTAVERGGVFKVYSLRD